MDFIFESFNVMFCKCFVIEEGLMFRGARLILSRNSEEIINYQICFVFYINLLSSNRNTM